MSPREASGRRFARPLVTAGLLAAALLGSPRARAQDAGPPIGWSGEIRTEPSAVRIEGRDVSWWYNHAEVQYRAENKDIAPESVVGWDNADYYSDDLGFRVVKRY